MNFSTPPHVSSTGFAEDVTSSTPTAAVIPNEMYTIPFVLSIVSLLGSAIVLVTFASSKKLRTFLLQPVLLMIFFDALASVGNVLMFVPPIVGWDSMESFSPMMCTVVGAVLGNMAQQASILFYLCVVVNMMMTIYRKSAEETTEDFRRFMSRAVFIETVLVGLYCVGSTLCLLLLDAFGAINKTSEKYECWIKADHTYARLVLYVPLIITMVVAAGALSFIYLQGSRRMMPEAWRYTSRRIMLFVVVFLCLWTGPTIFRMYELADQKYMPPDWLLIFVKAMYGVNGLVNSLVWTTSKPFLEVYRQSERCFCCSTGESSERGAGGGNGGNGGSGRLSSNYDRRKSSGYSGTSSINLDAGREEDTHSSYLLSAAAAEADYTALENDM